MKKYSLYLLLVLCGLSACKEVGPNIDLTPEPQTEYGQITDTLLSEIETVQDKNILMEEFTGIACQNCPDGHAIAASLKASNDHLYVISVHAGFFADPTDNSKFDEDLRTTEGDELLLFLGESIAFPSASIDRVLFDGESNRIVGREKWAGLINSLAGETTPVNIHIENLTYDETSRQLVFEVRLAYTSTVTDKHYLSVSIVEDKVTTKQLDGSTWLDEYEQPHVLRKMLTKSGGDVLGDDKVAGTQFMATYLYDVPADFDINNVEVFAYVNELHTDGKKEVIHVKETPVITE